jgi:hypothetical protein
VTDAVPSTREPQGIASINATTPIATANNTAIVPAIRPLT